MKINKTLIAIAAYKEAENLKHLIKQIRLYEKSADILIINDKSDDNTSEVLKQIDKNIILIERPKKLGLGTAHILCMIFAIKFNYKFLLTMDADFSHNPSHIPEILKLSGENNFVIGSRFCIGGKSDYKGFKKIISIIANYLAKNLLSIKLNEITTYYRLYSVDNLKKLPFNELNAQGYSLGVKIIWLLSILKVNLYETPIHMNDRNKGVSKIPKFQIFVSAFDLFKIKFKDIFFKEKIISNVNRTYNATLICTNCKNSYFSLLKKNIFRCLICLNNEKLSNE